jgi:hypothetical protein
MKPRLLAILAWLTAGHATLLGLAWLLVRVPESNALMLAVSLAIALSIVGFAGFLEGAALAAWQAAEPARPRTLARRGLSAIAPFLAGLLVFSLVWWLTGRAAGWWEAHAGEIDAWLIATFGWTRSGPLHAAFGWATAFVRYVVGLSLALTLVGAWLASHPRPTGLDDTAAEQSGAARMDRWPAAWLRRALLPRRLVTIAALLMLFGWLPWQAVYWRPRWLAPNWQELAFASIKLGALYLYATLGWALVLRATARPKP